jgi:hypothetical protein
MVTDAAKGTRGKRVPAAAAANRRGSLLVVGTGINGAGQATLEAIAGMRQAEKLYYGVTEPTTEMWIRELNPTATSLARYYGDQKDRRQTYTEMTRELVEAVRSGLRVCAAFYGHPGVLVNASHRAVRQLKRDGYSARMLPGVSADGCLYADLGVNPGDVGMQSFEATEFLLFRRRFDPTSGLMLWQVGALGENTGRSTYCRPDRLARLVKALRRHYPASHRIVVYYAATFPAHPPIVERVSLERLPRLRVAPMATLYVPPRPPRKPAADILRWFNS